MLKIVRNFFATHTAGDGFELVSSPHHLSIAFHRSVCGPPL